MDATASSFDNPMWASLSTLHRELALGAGGLLRFPADVAPFVAVAGGGAVEQRALEALVAPGESVYFLAVVPDLPAGFTSKPLGHIVQMVCPEPLPDVEGPAIVPLEASWRAAVLDLTARVYPHYFRPRTMVLGRYRGIVEGNRLLAMAGERMGFPGAREISAVCTDPGATGRGLARRLLAVASNAIFASNETPFLHVSPDNGRALALYEQNGYRVRAKLPFVAVQRSS